MHYRCRVFSQRARPTVDLCRLVVAAPSIRSGPVPDLRDRQTDYRRHERPERMTRPVSSRKSRMREIHRTARVVGGQIGRSNRPGFAASHRWGDDPVVGRKYRAPQGRCCSRHIGHFVTVGAAAMIRFVPVTCPTDDHVVTSMYSRRGGSTRLGVGAGLQGHGRRVGLIAHGSHGPLWHALREPIRARLPGGGYEPAREAS